MKSIYSLFTAAALLCAVLITAGCGTPEATPPKKDGGSEKKEEKTSSTTPDTEVAKTDVADEDGMVMVSLELPGMT